MWLSEERVDSMTRRGPGYLLGGIVMFIVIGLLPQAWKYGRYWKSGYGPLRLSGWSSRPAPQ